MPFSFQHKGSTVRVSLKDIFKTSKALKEDLDQIARKRAAIADKNALIERILKDQEAEKKKETQKGGKNAEGNGNANGNVNANANAGGDRNGTVRFGQMQTYTPGQQQEQQQVQQQQQAPGTSSGPVVFGATHRWVPPGKQQDGEKGKGNTGGSTPNAGNAWTDEQDAELRRMKNQNGQWKAIAMEFGRHVNEVKARWKQIQPPEEGTKENEKKGKEKEKEKEKEMAESTKGESSKPEKSKKGKARKKQTEPDPDFTVAELILLNQLAAKYEDDKWLRISSRFFDKTGKRLSPEEAKARVESWS